MHKTHNAQTRKTQNAQNAAERITELQTPFLVNAKTPNATRTPGQASLSKGHGELDLAASSPGAGAKATKGVDEASQIVIAH